jgi:hypothetical protein
MQFLLVTKIKKERANANMMPKWKELVASGILMLMWGLSPTQKLQTQQRKIHDSMIIAWKRSLVPLLKLKQRVLK